MAILSFLVFVGGLPFSPHLPPDRAAAAFFTLLGRIGTSGPAGWGFTKTTISSPGPDLVVSPGETVTMMLGSADPSSIGHDWGVDYNNNTAPDPGEPLFPQVYPGTFNSLANKTFIFTATMNPGRYLYYCYIHGVPMFGRFIVTPPAADVAVIGITPSRTFAYNGVFSNPVQVNVTAANVGTQTQTFFVSALANSTLIGNQTETMLGGTSTVVTFQWATSSLPRGNYTLTAQATRVAGETNFANNSYTGNTFTVKLRGDVNGDCIVNVSDLSTVGGRFGLTKSDPRYFAPADFFNTGVINVQDFSLVGGTFGLTC